MQNVISNTNNSFSVMDVCACACLCVSMCVSVGFVSILGGSGVRI